MFSRPSEGVDPVGCTRDVVADEHTDGLVPADAHGHRLRHASSDHVSDGCAPQVVKQATRRLRLLAGFLPRFAEINNRLAAAVKNELRQLCDPVLLFNRASVPSPNRVFPDRPETARLNHMYACTSSCGTPLPSSYMNPRLYCAPASTPGVPTTSTATTPTTPLRRVSMSRR